MLRRTPLARGTSQLKRTALKRGCSTLGRSTKLKQKRKGPPRRSSRVRDEAHLAWIRTLPCCVCHRAPPSDPHHGTQGRGLSQKQDDTKTIPLCRWHHDRVGDLGAEFKGWTRDQMREWFNEKLAKVIAQKPQAPTHIELRFASGRRARVAVTDCTEDAEKALVLPVLPPEFDGDDVVEAVGIVLLKLLEVTP